MEKINSPITTIPGIGTILGSIIIMSLAILAILINLLKLVAYAGIDATISQSGEFEGTHNIMSKTCIGAVVRKMCNIIYSVLKNNTPYEVLKQ